MSDKVFGVARNRRQRPVEGTGHGFPLAGTLVTMALPSGVCHL
jgi:hypothetical protein